MQAKVGTTLSNTVNLNIYWEVNGHRLPPEPDSAVNNSTLLGVDVNGNGVRDDVERKIYEKYPVKLHQSLLMDGAKVFQKITIRPIERAKETQKEISRIIDCEIFLGRIDSEISSDSFESISFLENYTFTTKQRVRKYLDYNIALSGGVYGSSPADWNRNACSQEVRKVLEEMGK